MALITCDECGGQVSDKAAACPKCGAPVVPVSGAPQAGAPDDRLSEFLITSPADKPTAISDEVPPRPGGSAVVSPLFPAESPPAPRAGPDEGVQRGTRWVVVGRWVVGGVFVLGIIVVMANMSGSTASSSAEHNPEITVDAQQLWRDYDANEVAADAVYKGKWLSVTGVVASIDKDFMGHIILDLQSPNDFMPTSAKLESSDADKAAALSKGTQVSLVCKGEGRLIGSPNLEDCNISSSR
jgi:hypothetical protein